MKRPTPPPPPIRKPAPRPTKFEDIEDMLPIEEPPVIAPPAKPIAEPPVQRPRPTIANNYNAGLGRTWTDWLQFVADLAGALTNPSITRLRFEQEQANQEQLDK